MTSTAHTRSGEYPGGVISARLARITLWMTTCLRTCANQKLIELAGADLEGSQYPARRVEPRICPPISTYRSLDSGVGGDIEPGLQGDPFL